MSSKPKGVQPKRSGVVKLASQEVIEAVKQPLPTGQLEAIQQSFAGNPPPPTTKKSERILIAAEANPLLKPLPKIPKKIPEDTGASLPPPPLVKKKQLKFAKPTPDIESRKTEVPFELQEAINTTMDPLFKEYQEKQNEIQSKNPYLTDIEIYTPQTRKSFYKFIADSYISDFKLKQEIKGKIDEDACTKLGAAAGIAVEAFLYQKFIREYIRNASPYRGILVYHGLGSGKTCSSIAAAEALYGTTNKKIIVMTPFSLRGNFMSEISFCGFRHFNLNNHWVSESLISEKGLTYLYANSVLSLSNTYLNKVLERPEEERKVIWIPDFTKPPNYDDLTQQERDDIRSQITNMIENRITFISYNGITAKELKKYACRVDPETGDRFFDNAIIVIDEIHNLSRLMQGEVVPYITKRKGRARKIPVEPIVPGKWTPGLCNSELNYKRAYIFYRLLTDARNSKIIGLSGTPIINFPDELGILANVLGGYIECAELNINTVDKTLMNKFKKIAESEPRVDIVRFITRAEKVKVLISVFNEGYEKVNDTTDTTFVGIRYNSDAQDSIKTVYKRIKEKAIAEKIPISEETYVSYPRLPIDDAEFKDEFIDPITLSIKNKVVLQKRLTGLISYYKGSKEEYMPRVIKDEVVKCDMSDYVLLMYTVERNKEIKGEKRKEKGEGDQYAAVEMFAKMKNPSSYRFRSRALCNFAFPKGIERPFPDTLVEEEEEVDQPEDIEFGEAATEVQEDLDAQEVVAAEEAAIPSPDEEERLDEAEVAEVAEEGKKEEEEDVERIQTAAVEEAVEDKALQQGGQGEDDKPQITKRVRPKVAQAAAIAPSTAIEEGKEGVESQIRVPRRKPKVGPPTAVLGKEAEVAAEAEEVKSEAAAEYEVKQEKVVSKVVTYQDRLKRAMEKLAENKDKYLKLDSSIPESRLSQYSSKLDQMIRRILVSKGSNLVYSQFKTVEGLGVLRLALEANGFIEIEIEGDEWQPRALRTTTDNRLRFSAKTVESLKKGPNSGEKRFIFLTGEGLREKRNLILNIFNGNFDRIPEDMRRVLEESGYGERKNKYGEICWVFGITGAGAEGISLKCCRSVHIMEPYWNKVRLDQVKGRAVRICSHQDLPYNEREVEVYTYYTVFSADQKNNMKIDTTINITDEGETSDEKVYNVSLKKDKINQELLELMKETAVDCGLNAADNEGVTCFEVLGRPDQYLFDPDLEVDKILTNIELKEVVKEKTEIRDTTKIVEKELGQKAMPKPDREIAQVVQLRRVSTMPKEEFIIFPKKGSGGMLFNIYERLDDRLEKPIGELALNPATGTFKGSVPIFR